MPLDEYHRKRDFASTPEPAGTPEPASETGAAPLTFVVHKHAARALHYDLRLEVGGVYASWAVPKGPSLDTTDKRLAVHVEDHPLEYGTFEGTIPEGEYGGGTVMIWDRGTYEPVGDPAACIAKGDFKFVLSGTKLRGQWVLVRMKPRPGEKRENWLLIKERDENVRPHGSYDVLTEEPDSAATGRTMEQIAVGQAPDAAGDAGTREDAATTPMPVGAAFQLATLVDDAPSGGEWIHEVKYDGYRLQVALENSVARVLTRNGKDWTERFPTIARAVAALPATSVLLDGEAVVMDSQGRSGFGVLQEALSAGHEDVVTYKVFDLLYMNGCDLRAETLLRRKELLTKLLASAPTPGALSGVDYFEGHGPDFHAASCALLLEGSVSKRADRPWVPGRTRDWLKAKCLARQEFVIGGWTDPAGARHGLGALLLGVHDQTGGLLYAGRVGTGFTERELAELRERLDALTVDSPPFVEPPHAEGVHWVRPELVADVTFREWTREDVVRQAAYKGLREDKSATEVVREIAGPVTGEAGTDGRPPASGPGRPVLVRGVTITHPWTVLEPAGIAKLQLARYYDAVASHMLAHVADRPLTIVRCPHNAAGHVGCFYQKHPEARGWPDTFGTVRLIDSQGPADYFYVEKAESLVALAQLGTLEIHTWNSLASDPEHPDRIVFDLDPGPGVSFAEVSQAALIVRDALKALGLGSFVKTTGGHGLHVVTPIVPQRGYDEVRDFAHAMVDFLVREAPDRFIGVMSKEKRPGLVFIDYLRNAHGATAVCAYSTRARPGTPVSVPVTWNELVAGIDPASFDTVSVPARLASMPAEPWLGYDFAREPLSDAIVGAVTTGVHRP
jgi:bifunctional non-homologous end joining protein LigD